jgi:hypothetical protein
MHVCGAASQVKTIISAAVRTGNGMALRILTSFINIFVLQATVSTFFK